MHIHTVPTNCLEITSLRITASPPLGLIRELQCCRVEKVTKLNFSHSFMYFVKGEIINTDDNLTLLALKEQWAHQVYKS